MPDPKATIMIRALFFVVFISTVKLQIYPYNTGSLTPCHDSSVCPDGECCILAKYTDGPAGENRTNGHCFTDSIPVARHHCMNRKRALPHWCDGGDDCRDDECCVQWIQLPGLGRREPAARGACEKLGHYDSECRLDHFPDANNPRPDTVVKSCPCHIHYNCTAIDDNEPTKGICI